MTDQTPKPEAKKLPAIKRKTVSLSQENLVTMEPLHAEQPLPLVIRPAVDGVDLLAWAQGNRQFIESAILTHGGVLFRGFPLETVADFERFITSTSDSWTAYREPATPRSQVSGNIFTSTDYPAEHPIFLHNENSHCTTWPLKIFFFCVTPAESGGETPIADCRAVYRRIDPAIRERFEAKGWMYVRNFGDGLGFGWQQVFETDSREGVEAYCRANGMQALWKDNNRLRTQYVRPAVVRHPRTGEPIWFNHGTFFHVSTLSPSIREALLADFGEDGVPYNTYYGDGTRIEPEVMDHLREAYQRETIAFPWQKGDLLMLDNMLVAHGRAPYSGARKTVVGMAETYGLDADHA
jgi:alpha-ketoglutarate-dependent taurine dioxygenase